MSAKKIKIILTVFAVMITGAILLLFFIRFFFLTRAIEHYSAQLQKQYGISLIVKESSFKGLFTIDIQGFSVINKNAGRADTLLTIDALELIPSPSLFLMDNKLNSLDIKRAQLNIICEDSFCNYKILSHSAYSLAHKKTNTNELIYHNFKKVFDLIPKNLKISEIFINYRKDSSKSEFLISNLLLRDRKINIEIKDSTTGQNWQAEGDLFKPEKKFHFKIFPLEITQNSKQIFIPLANELFQLTAGFDTVWISLENNNYSSPDNRLNLKGNISLAGIKLFHKKLSSDTVAVDKISLDYNFNIGNNTFEADSSSLITINKIPAHLFFKVEQQNKFKPINIYTLNFQTEAVPSTNFFHSLPKGLFERVRDIQAEGTLKYVMHFKFNPDEPDSVEFESDLKKEKFKIKKLGKENFYKLNSEFIYVSYEYGRPARTLVIGPHNQFYVPLYKISFYLKNAILNSEDGSFYYHNGFNIEQFRKAIATNFKTGKFVRGASTISMQLIKNIFLNRNKTISRKMEEAFIVWLIESNRMVSKERIFEVYLNMVELGPGIYGVGEASRFYFNKKASDLTLSESIFIASLLPHPKWFKYSFDAHGNLKSHLADYYRIIARILFKKGIISEYEYYTITPNVKLTGRAKYLVLPNENIPEDDEDF